MSRYTFYVILDFFLYLDPSFALFWVSDALIWLFRLIFLKNISGGSAPYPPPWALCHLALLAVSPDHYRDVATYENTRDMESTLGNKFLWEKIDISIGAVIKCKNVVTVNPFLEIEKRDSANFKKAG